jgi:hypothetical protein
MAHHQLARYWHQVAYPVRDRLEVANAHHIREHALILNEVLTWPKLAE